MQHFFLFAFVYDEHFKNIEYVCHDSTLSNFFDTYIISLLYKGNSKVHPSSISCGYNEKGRGLLKNVLLSFKPCIITSCIVGPVCLYLEKIIMPTLVGYSLYMDWFQTKHSTGLIIMAVVHHDAHCNLLVFSM